MIVESIGYNFSENRKFNKTRENGLNCYLLLIIHSSATFGDQEDKRILPNGAIILFNKNTPQYFGAVDDNYVNDWVAFSLTPEEERSMLNDEKVFDTPIQDGREISFASSIVKLMQEEVFTESSNREQIIKMLLRTVVYRLHLAVNISAQIKPYYNQLLSIRTKIHNNPLKKYKVEDLSAEISLSKSYFQHLYKSYFNTTPISDAINSRVEYAKELLTTSNLSIKEISEILLYTTDTQFMHQFKEVTKVTPSEYRKANQ